MRRACSRLRARTSSCGRQAWIVCAYLLPQVPARAARHRLDSCRMTMRRIRVSRPAAGAHHLLLWLEPGILSRSLSVCRAEAPGGGWRPHTGRSSGAAPRSSPSSAVRGCSRHPAETLSATVSARRMLALTRSARACALSCWDAARTASASVRRVSARLSGSGSMRSVGA